MRRAGSCVWGSQSSPTGYSHTRCCASSRCLGYTVVLAEERAWLLTRRESPVQMRQPTSCEAHHAKGRQLRVGLPDQPEQALHNVPVAHSTPLHLQHALPQSAPPRRVYDDWRGCLAWLMQ